MIAGALTFASGEMCRLLEIEKRAFVQPWALADFELLSQDDRAQNLGLWRDEELVGYAIGMIESHTFHLANLAVDSQYQRQGWGSRLLLAALERAEERGSLMCRLEVRFSNSAAQNMYRKFGFAVDGIRRRFYTKPVEDAWLFSRPLSGANPNTGRR